MRIYRTIISTLLAVSLFMGLAACKGKDNEDTTADSDEGISAPVQVFGESGTVQGSGYSENVGGDNGVVTPSETRSGTSGSDSGGSDVQAPGSEDGGSGERETVRVTIPEGYTLTQIFKKLEANGVCSFDELMSTAQSYDYSYYPLIAARPSNTRAFKLEGYLFPNTYDFYKNEKPQDAIGRFLRVAESQITSSHRSRAKAMGYSMDEILTVASIIEKEGSNSAEVSKIAAVIYNRLDAGMKLQMDSGIYYIEDRVKPYIGGDINRYNSLYNMYKCSGLPAGPICNPGMKTINAALNPADVDYLYFCHDENANYYYAETYEEHLENLKKAGIEG